MYSQEPADLEGREERLMETIDSHVNCLISLFSIKNTGVIFHKYVKVVCLTYETPNRSTLERGRFFVLTHSN